MTPQRAGQVPERFPTSVLRPDMSPLHNSILGRPHPLYLGRMEA